MALGTKIMFFMLLINISTGILTLALNDRMPTGLQTNVVYDESQNIAKAEWQGDISPPGVDPSSGWWIRFLDFISMGYYTKIKGLLDNTIFNITTLFVNFGVLSVTYKPYFDFIITLIYIIAVVEIFTGKNIGG